MAFQMPTWNAPRGVSLNYRPMQTPLPQQLNPAMLAAMAKLPSAPVAAPPPAVLANPVNARLAEAQKVWQGVPQQYRTDGLWERLTTGRNSYRGSSSQSGRMGGTGGGPGRTGGLY